MEEHVIEINMNEENLDLVDVIYRTLSQNVDEGVYIDYNELINNLSCPDLLGLKVAGKLYIWKIKV